MKELESLLSDIPLEEREEALWYYNDYFEDAGEAHEEEIIQELVSPEKVAATIKTYLTANEADRENRGYYTENGYQDTINNEYEIVGAKKQAGGYQAGNRYNSDQYSKNTHNQYDSNTGSANNTGFRDNTSGTGNADDTKDFAGNGSAYQSYDSGRKQQYQQGYTSSTDHKAQQSTKNTNIALVILICILGFPFIISAFSVAFGIVMTIIGIIVGFGCAGVAMIGVGIALIFVGLVKLSVPLVGLLFCGSGLIVFGLGMLFTLACIALCKNVLPAFVRGVINLCRKPFQNRSVTA
jgi:Predicted membrane protein